MITYPYDPTVNSTEKSGFGLDGGFDGWHILKHPFQLDGTKVCAYGQSSSRSVLVHATRGCVLLRELADKFVRPCVGPH